MNPRNLEQQILWPPYERDKINHITIFLTNNEIHGKNLSQNK